MIGKFPPFRQILLGFWVFFNLILNLWAFRALLENFADFRIEMPVLTLIFIRVISPLPLLFLAPWAIFAAWGTARNERLALWLALSFCGLCALLFVAGVWPLTILANALTGGAPVELFPLIQEFLAAFNEPFIWGFWSNLALTFALIFKIRKRAATLKTHDFDDR